jgi:hypothetical protein
MHRMDRGLFPPGGSARLSGLLHFGQISLVVTGMPDFRTDAVPWQLPRIIENAGREWQAMKLTRRPDKDPHRRGWFVYFNDVRVGHIGIRAGVPVDEDQWGWSSDSIPAVIQASTPMERRGRSSRKPGRDSSRRAPRRTTSCTGGAATSMPGKYRMHDEGLKLPTQNTNGVTRCVCGDASEMNYP